MNQEKQLFIGASFFFTKVYNLSYNKPHEQKLFRKIGIVVISFLSSYLGRETAKGIFRSWINLPPNQLSTTHGGGFTLSP